MAIARRIGTLLIALALVVGVMVHVPAAAAAGDETAGVAAVCDMAQPAGACGGCRDHAMTAGACAVACSGPAFILAAESGALVPASPTFILSAEPVRSGQSAPPDPYPPRPLFLG